MDLSIAQLSIDISTVDQNEILSDWKWLLPDIKSIVLITCMGDLFIEDTQGNILFLLYDGGDLEIVANSKAEFERLLEDDEKVDSWFLPSLFEKLVNAGKILKENQVYSLLKLGILGGEYNVENIQPTNVSVHFSFSGSICRQLWDIPDGTEVNIVLGE